MNMNIRNTVEEILYIFANKDGGSDVHIVSTQPNFIRFKQDIIRFNEAPIVENNGVVRSWLLDISANSNYFLSEEAIDNVLIGKGDLDFSHTVDGCRFRIHVGCIMGGHYTVVARKLGSKIPELTKLNLPAYYEKVADYPQGLVLITGATGSGKTTTNAALLELINRRHPKKIGTLEDPIEYQFEPKLSLIHQKEIGRDIATFDAGLTSLLREDPDVILIGEIRDINTLQTALTLSSSGHTVFATLHTSGVIHTIGRILSISDSGSESNIRNLLEDNLRCIINQSLYRTKHGDVLPLVEHLFTDHSTARIFGNNMKNHQVQSILDTTSNQSEEKMTFRWQSILKHYNEGFIDLKEATELIELYDIKNIDKFNAQKQR